jgi:hypothetical protein
MKVSASMAMSEGKQLNCSHHHAEASVKQGRGVGRREGVLDLLRLLAIPPSDETLLFDIRMMIGRQSVSIWPRAVTGGIAAAAAAATSSTSNI